MDNELEGLTQRAKNVARFHGCLTKQDLWDLVKENHVVFGRTQNCGVKTQNELFAFIGWDLNVHPKMFDAVKTLNKLGYKVTLEKMDD